MLFRYKPYVIFLIQSFDLLSIIQLKIFNIEN